MPGSVVDMVTEALEALGRDASLDDVSRWVGERYDVRVSDYRLRYSDLSAVDKLVYLELSKRLDRDWELGSARSYRKAFNPLKLLVTSTGVGPVFNILRGYVRESRGSKKHTEFMEFIQKACVKHHRPFVAPEDFPDFHVEGYWRYHLENYATFFDFWAAHPPDW